MALTDDLFEAVDTIVSARLANLPYDQTIECEIIDDSDKIKGEYQVQHQNATFLAFGTPNEYKKSDVVYVSVPQGDYTENKFIINKKNSGDAKKVKGLPFLQFVKGPNLFDNTSSEFQIQLNNPLREFQNIFTYSKKNILFDSMDGGFTRLGLKCAINGKLTQDIVSGDYGIQLSVLGFDQKKTYLSNTEATIEGSPVLQEKIFTLYTADMSGTNLYNTHGYCNQEKVFDITDFYIVSINVNLYQNNNFYTSRGDKLLDQRISVKNIQLYLGYSVDECVDAGETQLFLYSNDGKLYNSNYLSKNIKGRVITIDKNDRNTYKINNNYTTSYYQGFFKYYLEEYNVESEYADNPSGKLNYRITSVDTEKEYALNWPQQSIPSARSRMYAQYVCVIQGTGANSVKLVSNELQFINAAYLADSEVVDIVMGFSSMTEDESGSYFIYGRDNKAIDLNVVAKVHYIILNYNPISEDGSNKGFQVGDIITWRVPKDNTMITSMPIDIDNDPQPRQDSARNQLIYEHTVEDTDITINKNEIKIPYKISDYYTPLKNQNTIEMSLTRQSMIFNTSQNLLFGTSGSQGSEYTTNIKIMRKKADNSKEPEQVFSIPFLDDSFIYYPEIEVYDYSNQLVNIKQEQITWTIITYGLNGYMKLNSNKELEFNNVNNMSDCYKNPCILQAKIELDNTGGELINLFSFSSLPVCKANTSYVANGSTILTYDNTGKKPTFTKTPFQLSDIQDINIRWSIESPTNNDNDIWKPILVGNKNNELAGPSIFDIASKTPKYTLIAENNDGILWLSTIYMFQHRYPNATEYEEFNKLVIQQSASISHQIDEIMAGRIKTENNNSNETSGVFIGNVNGVLGLYAFRNSIPVIEILETGTVLLDGINDNDSALNIKDATINSSTIKSTTIINCNFDTSVTTDILASTANWAVTANWAITANYANNSGTAEYGNLSGTATWAVTAGKINTNAGSASLPVYFANGVPVQCNTSLSITAATATWAVTAGKLNTNAGSNSKPVYFSNGIPVQCTSLDITAATATQAVSASTAGTATWAITAGKINTNAGSDSRPVYFSNGLPVQCNSTLTIKTTTANHASTAGYATTAKNYTNDGTIATALGNLATAIAVLQSRVSALESMIH